MSSESSTNVDSDVAKYALEFEALRRQRHQEGEAKYGPVKFLEPGTDLFHELQLELVDAANYAMYHYVRLRMLRDRLERKAVKDTPLGRNAVQNAWRHE